MATHLNNETEMLYHQINSKSNKKWTKESLFSHKASKDAASRLKSPTTQDQRKYKQTSSLSQYFNNFKLQMIFVILCSCLLTCCIKYANTQEAIDFYTNGNLRFLEKFTLT